MPKLSSFLKFKPTTLPIRIPPRGILSFEGAGTGIRLLPHAKMLIYPVKQVFILHVFIGESDSFS